MRNLFIFIMFAPGLLHAGNEKGNGDAIVCRDSQQKVTQAELLDYWEGEFVRHVFRSLGNASLPVGKKVETALQRLDRLDPVRTTRYWQQASTFFDEALCLSRVHLPDMNDTGMIPKPDNCEIVPVALQKEPFFVEDRRYWINADYWTLFDNDSRAGLVLHEIIYREAMSHGQQDSIITRYLNALFTSEALEKWEPQFYLSEMVRFGFNDPKPKPEGDFRPEHPPIRMPDRFCEVPR